MSAKNAAKKSSWKIVVVRLAILLAVVFYIVMSIPGPIKGTVDACWDITTGHYHIKTVGLSGIQDGEGAPIIKRYHISRQRVGMRYQTGVELYAHTYNRVMDSFIRRKYHKSLMDINFEFDTSYSRIE